MSVDSSVSPAPRRRFGRLAVAVPLILFAGLALLFAFRLGAGDPSKLPSALIGRMAPDFVLPPVQGSTIPGFSTADLRAGRVTVVNVWASWCAPCREEHPHLIALARDPSIVLVGINNKDAPDNARRFLGQLGNPYARIGADLNGRVSIDWGVYGVPETFVVDGTGRITFKHVGPITPEIIAERLMPAIRRAAGAG
jgi:cytochrome c biogenesis protein CcmG/thiol:disulfide interchange protein DsbE